jgi:hypothetical protein
MLFIFILLESHAKLLVSSSAILGESTLLVHNISA